MSGRAGGPGRRSSAPRGERRPAGARRSVGGAASGGSGPSADGAVPGERPADGGGEPREAACGAAPSAAGARDEPPGSPEDAPGDPESVARAICLRALTGAPKTRQQLADLLARRGVPAPAAVAVLDRFTEVGLIDDAAFARAWVSSRQAGRGLARRALRAELHVKGVDAETAAQAVEQVDDDDEREAARRLVERRLPAMRRVDRPTAMRRMIGLLARKGYSGGLAAAVVREALDADEAGAEGDLHGSDVHGSDVHGSDVQGSDVHGSDVQGSDVHGSDVHGPDVHGSDVQGSDVSGR